MAQVQSETVSLQLEAVSPALKPLFDRDGTTFGLWKESAEVEKISGRNMRIPLELSPPGKFRMTDFDGGVLGRGSGSTYIHAEVATKDFIVALETTKKVQISTDSSAKAIANAVTRDMKNGIKEIRWGLDALCQTAGTGQLSTIESGQGTTTLVLGSDFTTQLLHRGMPFQDYDAAFAAPVDVVKNVVTVDYATRTITIDVLITGDADGDAIVVAGTAGANPVSLYGIPYHFKTSGTWLGLALATYPELATPTVAAGGAALNPTHIRLALNRIRQRLGNDAVPSDLIAHMHYAQEDAYEQIGQAMWSIFKEPSANQGLEPFFKVKSMAGVPIVTSGKANPERIDFLAKSNLGRAVSMDIGFYTDPGDDAKVFGVYNSGGGRVAGSLWYLATSQQLFVKSPSLGAFISGLAVPTGYASA